MRTRPIVIELAGVAGAGKSTLARALARLDRRVRARPHVPRWSHLVAIPALVPTFLRIHWPFRGLGTKEMKRILRVEALHYVVREADRADTILFDEGPVYMLSRILMFGGDIVRSRAFKAWWSHAIAAWAATLDAVVWLESPDPVLAARVRGRAQWHPLQGAHDSDLNEFFRSYRAAFGEVVSQLCIPGRVEGTGGARLWNIATDAGPVDATAHAILDRLRALQGLHAPVPAVV